MRSKILLCAVVLALAATLPLAAEEPEGCDPADGRELVTSDGFEVTVGGAAPIPDPAAVRDATEGQLTAFRNAEFHLQAAFGDAERARVSMTLAWEDPTSDYDLHVIGDHGFPIAVSEDENAETGEAIEELAVTLSDCERFTVWIRNYAANPQDAPTLSMDVEPLDDVDPGEAIIDARTILYAGGDPGQVSMLHSFDLDEVPFRGVLSTERPDEGLPNQYTRYAIGSTTSDGDDRNPFQPHFAAEVANQPLVGDASALVYLSTALDGADLEGGEVLVRLLLDGMVHAEEAIPMEQLGASPAPFIVSFGALDAQVWGTVDLQVVAEPAASPNNPDILGEAADATYTLWYDSVQFPTRLILPELELR